VRPEEIERMTFVHERLRQGVWVPPWLRLQNLARYQWAGDFVRGRRVLEVGCGSGHGSKMLADAGAAQVIGIDTSQPSIHYAQHTYRADHLSFRLADGETLPVDDASSEVVVTFETIEHVDRDERFLQEIARVLRPDGQLLLSTPNRAVTNPGTSITDRPFNSHHVREYTQAEFQSLLQRHFHVFQPLGQSAYSGRYVGLLGRVGRVLPKAAVRAHQVRKLACTVVPRRGTYWPRESPAGWEPEVLVAVCSIPRSSGA
jgi:2-polyprenyl-3-methyl-5-hydroxy-6-metoxy-1,4-benzoquinol methylase